MCVCVCVVARACARQTVEKMMYDQKMKAQGKPTLDEAKKKEQVGVLFFKRPAGGSVRKKMKKGSVGQTWVRGRVWDVKETSEGRVGVMCPAEIVFMRRHCVHVGVYVRACELDATLHRKLLSTDNTFAPPRPLRCHPLLFSPHLLPRPPCVAIGQMQKFMDMHPEMDFSQCKFG